MSDRRSKYDQKHIRKTIRFSPDEWKQIEASLSEHDLTFTEFARSAIMRKKVKTNLTRELLGEVNRIGNNLNQIAKAVNSREKKDVLLELVQIERHLKGLLDGS
jgi:hypothetical protein